jgi:glycosyltransferase involved in cell wall biosynthesis
LLATARIRLRSSSAYLVHVLDGSYAYVAPGNRLVCLATVHDLIPWLQQRGKLGAQKGSILAAWLTGRVSSGLRRCRHLLAVSDNTAEDLAAIAEIDSAMVTIVPVALAPTFMEAAVSAASRRTDALHPYVLHVGNNSFYKNRTGVLRIFSRLDWPTELRLLMAGEPPNAELRELIHRLGLQNRVQFIEQVADKDLVSLYAGATLFLFPSLYEGFGWPPLEAMACGCPVVCSSEGSLPGVAGPAALMAPAADEDALADLCRTVLSDDALAHRLSEQGRAHARQFTLERMGQQIMAVYHTALDSGG